MSGICGLFNLDASSVKNPELRAMTAMLEQRGPERTGIWHEGSAGLGHTLLATTPELAFERQPFKHAETGCVITADVRLDNRDELLDALKLVSRRDSVGDAELILHAYLKWGEQCPVRLLGDFAFSIRDPRHQRMFCVRDHFGMRPIYYCHSPGRHFAFASDARAILVLPQIPHAVNKGRVADFLVHQLEWIDYTSTFYDHIYRLPPGHQLTVTPDRIAVTEYWKPQPVPQTKSMSDDDYRDGFLEVLTRAVDARLRAPPGTLGSMLSGGVDSGSVVAIGKDLLAERGEGPLPTYSATLVDDENCAESRRIRASASLPSLSPTLLEPGELRETLDDLLGNFEEPYDGEFLFLKAIFDAARKHGRKVLLDGAGGDVVLLEGTYINRLLRSGRLRLAMSEIAGKSRFWGTSVAPEVVRHFRSVLLPRTIKTRLRPLVDVRNRRQYLAHSLISREFADQIDINASFDQMRRTFHHEWEPDYATERCNAIRPAVTAGRERYARIAASIGMEARDPFLDKRVVDFCSRLPGHARIRNGWPKTILREVMADRLPDEVVWGRGKPHIGWTFNATATQLAVRGGTLELETLQNALAGYVDRGKLARAWENFTARTNCEPIHTANVLSLWLRENANRPVVPDKPFG